jgi:two-component system LytT family response regulator
MIRVLVVDDEPPARNRIKSLMKDQADLVLVGESGDGLDALQKVRELAPDLLFLDIRMPGMTGLELGRALRDDKRPYIVFTTAYDEYAADAFTVDAVDYLVKPFDKTRFREALARVRERIGSGAPPTAELGKLLERLATLVPGAASRDPERLAVKDGTRLRIIDLPQVTYIQADGDYLDIHLAGGEHFLIRERMRSMEQRVPAETFARISRSVLLNLHHVSEIRSGERSNYVFSLKSGERFASGTTYRDAVRALVERIRAEP